MEPFFSVIIPVYNVEDYLEQCIQSVLSQNFYDWEAILIDDGSTDGSGLLCDKFADRDQRVQVIHQENQGLASTRNTGLRRASGKWILFLDSDDFWKGGFLQNLYEKMRMAPNYEVYIGHYSLANSMGEIINDRPCFRFKEGQAPQGGLRKRFNHYYKMVDVAVWKMAVSSKWLKKSELKFERNIRYAEDVAWSLRMFQLAPKICYIDLPFVVYRSNREGALTTTTQSPLLNMESRLVAWRIFRERKGGSARSDALFAVTFVANKVIGEFQSQIKFNTDDLEREKYVIQAMQQNKEVGNDVHFGYVSLKRYLAARLLVILGPKKMATLLKHIIKNRATEEKERVQN